MFEARLIFVVTFAYLTLWITLPIFAVDKEMNGWVFLGLVAAHLWAGNKVWWYLIKKIMA